MIRRLAASLALLVFSVALGVAGEREEAFWEAARQGDLATIKKLQADGVDVNARTKYGATALSYACDKGHVEVVKHLLASGADINSRDEFYQSTPMGWALNSGHTDIVKLLMAQGAEGADRVLSAGVRQNDSELVAMALKSEEIDSDDVARALQQAAGVEDSEAIIALLQNADVKQIERVEVTVGPEVMAGYVGKYKNTDLGMEIEVRIEDGKLISQAGGQPALNLRALDEARFEAVEAPQVKISFSGRGGTIERLVVEQGGQTFPFPRMTEQASAAPEAAEKAETGDEPEGKPEKAEVEIVRRAQQNWPGFRGPVASGVGDGQGAPLEWNVETGDNVRWKTPIPGIANSSPIVWGDRIFVTTAISSAGDETFRTGLYGDVDTVDDESRHTFKVYGLDRASGRIIWEQTAAEAVPGARRHLKSTQANSTPVTDGKQVVALFGTIGLLVSYDLEGNLRWKADLGVLDAGWFYDHSYQWGHASSPAIYKDLVIVQADIYKGSFIAAYRLSDGSQVWKTRREEDVPSWGSPTVYRGEKRDELITNGNIIRGYDPASGKELWRLTPNSEVTVATPVVAHDLFYVTAGYPPARPVYAIRPGARGDISMPEGTDSSEAIAWSKNRGGTYMPTPIVYGDYLYTCANNGRLTAYEAKTGELVYRQRVGSGGSFTASPVAADGRLYFTNEDGDIVVARAGAEYEELARNEMGEVVMSTPAISGGLLVVRTLKHVYGLGEPEEKMASLSE